MHKFLFTVIIASSFVLQEGSAQNSDIYKNLKTRFPDEPAVFVERSELLSILPEGDSLRIFADVTEDILHLKEQSDAFSAGRVYGSHFSQVKEIKAKTLIWDKNRFKEMNVSAFKKNSDRDGGIFYDDSYYYSFNYPSVAMGNRTQLQYQSRVKEPKFIPGYFFSSYLPQSSTSYTIKTTKQVELVYNVINDNEHIIKFRKFEKGGFVYYEWSATDVAPRKTEDSSPSIQYYAPHVICYVKAYETKKGKVNVLSSLDDLYQWYYSFVENLNNAPSEPLASTVGKIKGQSKSELELVKNIFYWVQDNIQYVAFEEGMRGLIPHPGSYVFEKRYGDCKDMANLIVDMLSLANVKAYHTWIGTRDLPYRYSEVPTPLVDNHMIATYISPDGKYYFLDGTSDHTPFGMPSSMIQGKEALIGLNKNKYEVRTIPEVEKEKNVMVDSMQIRLDGNQIMGSGITTLRGYAKVFGGYELDRAEKDDVRKYVARLIGKGSNKFYLDRYDLSNENNRDVPTRIAYSFRIGDYFQKIGDELYINMNLNKDYYNAFINSSLRRTPMEKDYKYESYECSELVIPDGYLVEYLPPGSRVEGEMIGMETSYQNTGGKILYTKKLYLNYLLMKPVQFEKWNTSIREISDVYKESIILKKK